MFFGVDLASGTGDIGIPTVDGRIRAVPEALQLAVVTCRTRRAARVRHLARGIRRVRRPLLSRNNAEP